MNLHQLITKTTRPTNARGEKKHTATQTNLDSLADAQKDSHKKKQRKRDFILITRGNRKRGKYVTPTLGIHSSKLAV